MLRYHGLAEARYWICRGVYNHSCRWKRDFLFSNVLQRVRCRKIIVSNCQWGVPAGFEGIARTRREVSENIWRMRRMYKAAAMNLSCGRKVFVNWSSGLRWWIAVVNVDRLIERYQEAKTPPNAFKWRVLEPGIYLFVFNLFPIVPLRRPAVKYQRFVLYLCLLIPRWISALRCECSDDFSRSRSLAWSHAEDKPRQKKAFVPRVLSHICPPYHVRELCAIRLPFP